MDWIGPQPRVVHSPGLSYRHYLMLKSLLLLCLLFEGLSASKRARPDPSQDRCVHSQKRPHKNEVRAFPPRSPGHSAKGRSRFAVPEHLRITPSAGTLDLVSVFKTGLASCNYDTLYYLLSIPKYNTTLKERDPKLYSTAKFCSNLALGKIGLIEAYIRSAPIVLRRSDPVSIARIIMYKDNPEIWKILLNFMGATVQLINMDTFLRMVAKGQFESFKIVCSHSAVKIKRDWKSIAFKIACIKGKAQFITFLLDTFPEIDPNVMNHKPLKIAINSKQLEAVQAIINHARFNAEYTFDLFKSIIRVDSPEILEFMLGKFQLEEADMTKIVEIAFESNSSRCLLYLLKSNLVSAPTVLSTSLDFDDCSTIADLLTLYAFKPNDIATILDSAIFTSHTNLVEQLVNSPPYVPSMENYAAFKSACACGDDSTIKIFLQTYKPHPFLEGLLSAVEALNSEIALTIMKNKDFTAEELDRLVGFWDRLNQGSYPNKDLMPREYNSLAAVFKLLKLHKVHGFRVIRFGEESLYNALQQAESQPFDSLPVKRQILLLISKELAKIASPVRMLSIIRCLIDSPMFELGAAKKKYSEYFQQWLHDLPIDSEGCSISYPIYHLILSKFQQ